MIAIKANLVNEINIVICAANCWKATSVGDGPVGTCTTGTVNTSSGAAGVSVTTGSATIGLGAGITAGFNV